MTVLQTATRPTYTYHGTGELGALAAKASGKYTVLVRRTDVGRQPLPIPFVRADTGTEHNSWDFCPVTMFGCDSPEAARQSVLDLAQLGEMNFAIAFDPAGETLACTISQEAYTYASTNGLTYDTSLSPVQNYRARSALLLERLRASGQPRPTYHYFNSGTGGRLVAQATVQPTVMARRTDLNDLNLPLPHHNAENGMEYEFWHQPPTSIFGCASNEDAIDAVDRLKNHSGRLFVVAFDAAGDALISSFGRR